MNLPMWEHARNVLCVRLDYMGDVLMCTPAIRAIRQSALDRSVTLLTSKSGAAVVPFIPEVDDVIPYAAPWMKSSVLHSAADDQVMIETLRKRNFDAAVIFTTYSQNALPTAMLCYLAGIPLRIAYCRENPYQLLTDWLPEPEPERFVRHEVRRQLDLAKTIGCQPDRENLSFAVREADRAAVHQKLAASGIDTTMDWILLHPGATAQSRRYPPAHWAKVLAALSADGFGIVITGDASEASFIDDIMIDAGPLSAPVCSFAGHLDLGQLGAAIASAPVMISNNTGPAHIAAAVGTPIVDLYALTNPQHTPWQVPSRVLFHDVPCRFCYKSVCPQHHHDCLAKVEPSDVVNAARGLLHRDAMMPQRTAEVTSILQWKNERRRNSLTGRQVFVQNGEEIH